MKKGTTDTRNNNLPIKKQSPLLGRNERAYFYFWFHHIISRCSSIFFLYLVQNHLVMTSFHLQVQNWALPSLPKGKGVSSIWKLCVTPVYPVAVVCCGLMLYWPTQWTKYSNRLQFSSFAMRSNVATKNTNASYFLPKHPSFVVAKSSSWKGHLALKFFLKFFL